MSSGPLSLENRISVLSASAQFVEPLQQPADLRVEIGDRGMRRSPPPRDAESSARRDEAAHKPRAARRSDSAWRAARASKAGRRTACSRFASMNLSVSLTKISVDLARKCGSSAGPFGPARFARADEVEAVLVGRRPAGIAAQVPLADVGRRIAGLLEQRRVIGHARIEKLAHAARRVLLRRGIVAVNLVPRRILPGEERAAAGRADGAADVELREQRPLAGHPVEVRRLASADGRSSPDRPSPDRRPG